MTVFSRDHKVIGVQYALTAMVFLLLGFSLMIAILYFKPEGLFGRPTVERA